MKLKLSKVFVFSILIILLTSCYSTKYFGTYTFNLYKAQDVSSEKDVSKNITTGSTFQDSVISITILPLNKSISISLTNNTNSVIAIDWNNVVYYDSNGESSKTMHNGVKYNNRNEAQVPTTIIPNSKVKDQIIPTDKVYFSSGYSSPYSNVNLNIPATWKEVELFTTESKNIEKTKILSDSYLNKEIKLLVPITYKSKTINYVFTMAVKDYKIDKAKEYSPMKTMWFSTFGSIGLGLLFVSILI